MLTLDCNGTGSATVAILPINGQYDCTAAITISQDMIERGELTLGPLATAYTPAVDGFAQEKEKDRRTMRGVEGGRAGVVIMCHNL